MNSSSQSDFTVKNLLMTGLSARLTGAKFLLILHFPFQNVELVLAKLLSRAFIVTPRES
jgi:hypothetical protein